MTTYTLKSCETLIDTYINTYGGDMFLLEEGVLGLGKILLCAEGKKTVIIKEIYLTAWSSGHTIRRYNKTPKKYTKLMDKILEE